MKKINFIGAFDKTDTIMYIAKLLVETGNKVLMIDATINQKAKYIIPTLDSDSISYVTNYEGIDIALGFMNYSGIKQYLNLPE